MNAPTTARNLADYIITKCIVDDHPISCLQLDQIIYVLYMTWLRGKQAPLFIDSFVALPYGPVVPAVHERYIGHGGRPIEKITNTTINMSAFSRTDKEFIDCGIERLRKMSSSERTWPACYPESPWAETYADGKGHLEEISFDLLLAESQKKFPSTFF